MATDRTLMVLLCIGDESLRSRAGTLARAHLAANRIATLLPKSAIVIEDCATSTAGFECLKKHFDAAPNNAALLISDSLHETIGRSPFSVPRLSSWAKDLLDTFGDRLLGTMGIEQTGHRIPEIDRVVRNEFLDQEFLGGLELIGERLAYLAPPEPGTVAAALRRNPIVVRQIRTNAELRSYFLLRHQVYRAMGYLEPDVDAASSMMEMDWGDTSALHCGAFEQDGPRQVLVGTARVVGTMPLDRAAEHRTRALAALDPVLAHKIDREASIFMLPIFESMPKLNATFRKVSTEDVTCGELSRVIVAHSHRGTGLSEVLVRFAILQAMNRGVGQFFLECLPGHEALYRKLGFLKMEGVRGRVVGVGKTMIAMELDAGATEALRLTPESRRRLEIIGRQNGLCTCHEKECYKNASYLFYRTDRCPLYS